MALLTGIELCAGVGMLGEGARAAFEFLGLQYRTVCYVEREAPAASQLVTLMEAGALDPAPIWSDMLTFDGAAWRGRVDCVIAGFPCQDLSIAGRRAGLDGNRSGLFFTVVDIADACGARYLLLENVSGIASATATVMDEEEGELEERAAARVLGELADRGWDAEWITLSASDVGASHGRARWFCFAWRMADAARHDRDGLNREAGWRRRVCEAGDELAKPSDLGCERLPSARRKEVAGIEHPRNELGLTPSDGWRERRPKSARQQGRFDVTEHGCAVADPSSTAVWRNGGAAPCPQKQDAWQRAENGYGTERVPERLANASGPRQQGRELTTTLHRNRGGQEAYGSTSQLCSALGLFAPGPGSDQWPAIIDRYPYLAPATEPGLRGVVNGLALVVDESRTHQLRQVGNGVVPLCAAAAFVQLMRRAGLIPNFCE